MGFFTRVILIPALITFGYFYAPLIFEELKPATINPNMPQTQLTSSGPLFTENGTLRESGYMNQPLKEYNDNSLSPWQRFRVKKWDHWDVVTDKMVVTIAVADVGYLGEIRVAFFDFTTTEYKNIKKTVPHFWVPKLSHTSYKFTDDSKDDDFNFEGLGIVLKAENIADKDGKGYLTKRVFFSSEADGIKLQFDMKSLPDQDYIVTVVPLTPQQEHFLYTVRMPNIITEGSLKVGLKEYDITPNNAGAYLDYTRALWPYNTYWVFARVQGFLADGEMISLNLASGYADNKTAKSTDDAFFLGKTMYKLNTVQPTFDDNNLMNPFVFKTLATANKNFGECEVVFAPNYLDRQNLNLFVLKSEMRQLYGQFHGWVSDGKKKYNFENLNGFVEVYKGKW